MGDATAPAMGVVEALQMENTHLRQAQQRIASALRRTQHVEQQLTHELEDLREQVCPRGCLSRGACGTCGAPCGAPCGAQFG